jgi:nucleoside-diphosphate-sugar epimerase
LLIGLEKAGIPQKFVFVSTVAVYGKSEGHLINEQSELNAIDPYGKSKIQAEQLVSNWCAVNNVKCTILRLPLVVGLNPPGSLGAMIKGIRKGYYFNIAGGTAKKSMVLASDVAKFLLKASEIGGIFNLTDGYHPSFFELSENLSRQLGKSRSKNLPFWLSKCIARTGDVFGDKAPLNSVKLNKITSDLTFDDSKAREAFGWHPTPVLEGFDIS